MKYRIYFSLLMLFIAVGTVCSQKDATAEINKIKKSRNYLSATGTSTKSMEEASEYGRLLLTNDIEKWLKDNVKGDVTGYITKSKENLAVIETQRGSLYRSFIYVKKSDILPYYKGETVVSDIPQSVDTAQCEYVELTVPPASSGAGESSVDAGGNKNIVNPNAEEERKMLGVLTTKAFNQYLGGLKEVGRLNSYGMQKAWPVRGTVYVFFIDSDRSVGEHIRLVDGKAVDLRNGASVDIMSVKEKYNNGTYIWFTLK